MSGLRGRIERLAELAGQRAEAASLLIVERFGGDDYGGGYRGLRLVGDAEAGTVEVEGRPVVIREVMFEAGRRGDSA